MEAIFKALGDATRRDILDMLHKQDGQTLTELEEGLSQKRKMTRFGIMKHLKVLEEASLVVSKRSGRFKHHYLNAVPLQEVIDRWIEPLTQKPLARMLLDLKANLEEKNSMSLEEKRPDFVLETYIQTSPAALWDAITNADKTEQYHFARARATGSFEVGGEVHHLTPDGNTMLSHKITKVTPEVHLDMTFTPGWMPNAESSRVVYEIEDMQGTCKLTIMHYDIPVGQDGVGDGWNKFASSLKTFLETGKGLAFSA